MDHITKIEKTLFSNERKIKVTKSGVIGFVYCLFKDHELVYIGQTLFLKDRVIYHLTDKDFDSYSFVEVEENDLALVEGELIMKYQPRYNQSITFANGYISFANIKSRLGIDKIAAKKIVKKHQLTTYQFNGNLYISVSDYATYYVGGVA